MVDQAAGAACRPLGRADDDHASRTDTSYGTDDDDLIAGDELPATLVAMLRYVSEEYLPEISAHVDAANEWLAEHPEIEAGTNGLDDPATRGLTGGRGLYRWRRSDVPLARHRTDHQRHALPVLADATPPRRPGLCLGR